MRPALSFAVVREDAGLEAELVRSTSARQALLVASGGCTAFSLLSQFPQLAVTAFDWNPAQLAHVRAKHAAVLQGDLGQLAALSEAGAFEQLFRLFRAFLAEYVGVPPDVRSPFWPIAFAQTFDARLLEAVFGPDATQHAAPGSYPGYFQRAFEGALARPDAARNPFLQHILTGRFDAWGWMKDASLRLPTLIAGTLADVPDLARFDVVSLSNVFDWSADALVADWAARLQVCRPGTHVLIRQLNNRRPVERFFAPGFRFDDARGARLHAGDRSFFYERVLVGVRV